MPSRLLAQLDAAIDAAKDPMIRDRLRAERAGVLARHGNIGQSRRIVNELRLRSAAVNDAELAGWLSLAEGMADHFESLSPRARQRFMRAHALASSAGLAPLQSLAAAWLAMTEWNDSQWQAAIDHVDEALKQSADDAHAVRARACLVAADAYHFAGHVDLAQDWFERAREHANADGDTSMVSALLYNRAAARVNAVQLEDAFGAASDAEARRALLEAESTGHFDAGLGTASLKAVVPILRAQALVVHRRYAEALALYATHLEPAKVQGFASHWPRLQADVAWCHFHVGQPELAVREAKNAAAALATTIVHPDDRAATLGRAAQVLRLAGSADDALAFQTQADTALAEFRALQSLLLGILDKALSSSAR